LADTVLFFQKSVDINSVPLTEPVPGLSEAKYLKKIQVKPFDTKLSKLNNGLSVASEPHYGIYCTVGILSTDFK
uniref:Trafficking protein particle complex subunit n=1 Tax=Gongylonema pulchrum TaxID=637853 RepID=A0A183EWR7_9BILA